VTPPTGVAKIARFNWPWYALAVAVTVAGIVVIRSPAFPERWIGPAVGGLVVADFWLMASLAVSYYVYDRSPVSRGAWLDGVEPARVRRAAVFHAGQDEGSEAATRLLPNATVETFDFYDRTRTGSPSLERARALADPRARAIAPDGIPLEDRTLDLGLVVFAAHEIRRPETRTAFLRELARVTTPDGRIVVVEHLRDVWNFLAFGPGALHFLSRASWLSDFASADLAVVAERPCTPFVRVFELGRRA
jgi:SAM-dependent methyltransferase